MSFDFSRTQSPLFSGGGFLSDPFIDIAAGITTPPIQKSNKLDPVCLSNGALAGAIIATLIMSMFIGFLAWLIYLRPKFQELHYMHLYEKQRIQRAYPNQDNLDAIAYSNSRRRCRKYEIDDDQNSAELPLDVIDHKFGTFPFRHSQNSSVNGHYNRDDRLPRISSSFRSVNIEKDYEMVDVELLEPTFGGLNFSITGNMRAGIFVKEILDQGITDGPIKLNSSDKLRKGDRIMAITVCFESIVYEDALTILSYASPYPVILRVQRPLNHTKVNVVTEKRIGTATITSKVKWQDDFDHYDNDTTVNPSTTPRTPRATTKRLQSVPVKSKSPASPKKTLPSKRTQPSPNTQAHVNNKSISANRGNRARTTANSAATPTIGTTRRLNSDIKKQRPKTAAATTSNNNNTTNQPTTTSQPRLTSNSVAKKSLAKIKPTTTANPKTVRSVTGSVMSYLHYKGGDGDGAESAKDKPHNSETSMMPYYDCPYDYYYGQTSQYQYLHQSHLNRNNNNSLSNESLTAVTPNLIASIYTIQYMPRTLSLPMRRRFQRRLSSPAIMAATTIENALTGVYENDHPADPTDTSV